MNYRPLHPWRVLPREAFCARPSLSSQGTALLPGAPHPPVREAKEQPPRAAGGSLVRTFSLPAWELRASVLALAHQLWQRRRACLRGEDPAASIPSPGQQGPGGAAQHTARAPAAAPTGPLQAWLETPPCFLSG